MLISVIIPCYNEEEVVTETHKQLSAVMQQTAHEYELIFINDGSRDNTIDILAKIAVGDTHVKVLDFSRNFGQQSAVTAGINHCCGDVAVLIDADLQDPPEVILDMLNIQQAEKANVIYAVRKKRDGENWLKLSTSKMFYRILNSLSEVKIPADTGDFRLIDRKVIDVFNSLTEKKRYVRGLFPWMGFKQVPCYYERKARFAGETKWSFSQLVTFAMRSIFYFSKRPLQLATSVGIFCVLLGIIYVAWHIIGMMFLDKNPVAGWTSIVTLIVFMGGIQLLTIGILGHYIGSLFDDAKNRPEYIISNKINYNDK